MSHSFPSPCRRGVRGEETTPSLCRSSSPLVFAEDERGDTNKCPRPPLIHFTRLSHNLTSLINMSKGGRNPKYFAGVLVGDPTRAPTLNTNKGVGTRHFSDRCNLYRRGKGGY